MTGSAFSRRKLLKAGVAMGSVAFLAACTPAGKGATSGGAASLRFMTNHSTTEEAVFKAAVDTFKASNPKIAVEYLNIADLASYQTKIKTLAIADQLPDVFYTRTAEVPSQGKLEWNLDLTEYAKKNADVDDLWPAQVKQMTYKKQLLGLPYDFSNQAIYVNKTMFESEGIPFPEGDDVTWEELFDVAAAFKKMEGSQQVRWGISNRFDEWLWLGIFDSFGGGLLNKDQTKCTAALPENVDALRLFLNLYKSGTSPITAALPTGVDPFAAGLVAMQMNGSWAGQSRRDTIGDAFEWDVIKLPKGPSGKRSITANGGSWGVSSTTEFPDAAQQFCTFLAAPAQQSTFIAKPMRGIPGRPSVAAEWEKIVASANVPPASNKIFAEQMEEALDITYPVFWQEVVTSWTNRARSLTNPDDVKAALQGVQDDVNRATF